MHSHVRRNRGLDSGGRAREEPTSVRHEVGSPSSCWWVLLSVVGVHGQVPVKELGVELDEPLDPESEPMFGQLAELPP